MRLSLWGSPDFNQPVFASIVRQLEGIKHSLLSLGHTLRFDTQAMFQEDTQNTNILMGMADNQARCDLMRFGGNKELYDLVVGMTKGELFPLDRKEYGVAPKELHRDLDYITKLIEYDVDTKDVYFCTLNGYVKVGNLEDENSIFSFNDSRFQVKWNLEFDKGEPEELSGHYTMTSYNNNETPRGFEQVVHGYSKYFRPTGSLLCEFHGFATLEVGHPRVHMGGTNCIYVDHEAVYKEITKTFPYPSREEILAGAMVTFEKFREWILKAPHDEASAAISMFNEHHPHTLIRFDGYLSKKEREEGILLEDKYAFRIAIWKDVEYQTEFRGHFGKEEPQVYTSAAKLPLPRDFLWPLNGPCEDYPDWRKVNAMYVDVGLLRLVSGIESFLQRNQFLEVSI